MSFVAMSDAATRSPRFCWRVDRSPDVVPGSEEGKLGGRPMITEESRVIDDAGGLPENVDRLLRHLESGSLAARLVLAHSARTVPSGSEAMAGVLRDRLEQVRQDLRDD